jgi:HJR/Mrr/RecB family endonuclease
MLEQVPSREPRRRAMQNLTGIVHFEDFAGQQFERLCFAYLLRRHADRRVNWYGQLGADRGRDVVCTKPRAKALIVQCANFRRLTLAKARTDLAKLAKALESRGAQFLLITGGAVSGALKDKIIASAIEAGFSSADVISGVEFEESLRVHAPELLRRFVDGVPFPELAAELAAFTQSAEESSDDEIIHVLALQFDRPAFRTHFHQESSLPRFKEAIAETIKTLNTGETPQGAHVPSRHLVRDASKRAALDRLVGLLVNLRAIFDNALRTGAVKPCGCNVPDCPTFFVDARAGYDLDRRRSEILSLVRTLDADFVGAFY